MSTATPSVSPHRELKSLLMSDGVQQQIAVALPKHMTASRMTRTALTAMLRTPELAKCDPASFMQCMLTLSQLGLEPDGRRAHLIPFRNNKENRVDCTLIIDYKGIAELVQRSGNVSVIHADVVRDNDEFEYNMGEIRKHIIDYRKPRGKVYAVYSRIVMKDGTSKCEVMSRDEVEAVRSRSKAGGSGPWKTDWEEMAKKTVFRRASKWLPLSPEIRDAVEADDDNVEHTDAVAPITNGVNRLSTAMSRMGAQPEEQPAIDDTDRQDVPSPEEIDRLVKAMTLMEPDQAARLLIYEQHGIDPVNKLWPADGVSRLWETIAERNDDNRQ